jgi:hypothetical protein
MDDYYQSQALAHQQQSIEREAERRKEMFEVLKERRFKD